MIERLKVFLPSKPEIKLIFLLFKHLIISFLTFLIILIGLLFLSNFLIAFIKNINIGVGFDALVGPIFLLIPVTLQILLPISFIFSLAYLLYYAYSINFFNFANLRLPRVRFLITTLLIFSVFIGALIFNNYSNPLNKIDRYIEQKINSENHLELTEILEPLKFNRLGDYVIYIPEVKVNKYDKKIFSHLYYLRYQWLAFIGRGYVFKDYSGNIISEILYGFELDVFGRVKGTKSNEFYLIIDRKVLEEKRIRKVIGHYKNYISNPQIPITNFSHRYGFEYENELSKIILFKKSFYACPLSFLWFYYCR